MDANRGMDAPFLSTRQQKHRGRCAHVAEIITTPERAGWTPPDDLSFEGWEQAGNEIAGWHKNLQWMWGDWLNFGEKRYGEKYREVVEKHGLKLATAQKYAWIASTFEPCKRLQAPWSLHHEVAGIADETERTELLQQAVENKWSVARLRQEIKEESEADIRDKQQGEEDLGLLLKDVRAVCAKWRVRFGEDRLEALASLLQAESEATREFMNGRS